MVFTSLNFLIFFPIVIICYWLTPAKYRYILLLAASYFFYINVKPIFALLVAGVTLSTYIFTNLMDKTEVESRKKKLLILNIVIILLPLFFFKYFAEINSNLIEILQYHGLKWPLPEIKLLLPIGISFYTFMAIGYTVDVYNEEIEAEKNIGIVALFIAFFPLILSGPIERAKNMLPQFKANKNLDYSMVSEGLRLMLWGYFMKLVAADRLGLYVDEVFNNVSTHNGTTLLLASILYPFQLYADLGGYTLIAIGASKAMGIDVMHNFKRPFFAISISDFWRRWHISLISWLTDYVYTPLSFAFRSLKIWGIVIALMATFLISGIWHGAELTFVVWGIMQGLFLSFEALFLKRRNNFERKYKMNDKIWYLVLCSIWVFILFAFSQIFGRYYSISDAFLVIEKILTQHGTPYLRLRELCFGIFALAIVLSKDFFDEYFPGRFKLFNNHSIIVRFFSYWLVLFMIILMGKFGAEKFIYFQF